MSSTTFPFSVLSALQTHRARPSLVVGGESLSFEELDRWSNAIALGLEPGPANDPCRIGILAPSSFEYVAALCAIWKKGQIAVPLQPQHPLEELRYLVEDSGMDTVLVHPDFIGKASALFDTTPVRSLPIGRTLSAAAAPCPQARADQAALMIYTSGTTARPKGVVITFGNLEFQLSTLRQAWGWHEGDRAINALPLHHVHGIVNILLCSLASGACCELYAKFDAREIWERLASGEVTVFMAVPTIYSKLAQCWEEQPPQTRQRWSSRASALRLMVSGSAALPLPLFERWKSLTGHSLLERYGMTEIGMAISNPYRGNRKPKSVGKPLPGVRVRLVGDEIQVQSLGVFREYWRNPEATRASFTEDGWFRTGDQACIDEEGYYFILGRTSQDIIKSGGFKISALEIESVLLERDDLLEVAVLGIPDEEWGERVAAVCVWKQGSPDFETLQEWLRRRLASYKIPSLWKSLDALPKNAMGKVTKPALRAQFSRESFPKG